MSLLSVSNLNVWFGSQGINNKKTHAVRNLEFTLGEGECLAIVGESGCGKSASLLGILRLHERGSTQTGEVFYKEEALHDFSRRQMETVRGKEIAMIFQDPMSALNPTMKIGEQIAEALLNSSDLDKVERKNKVLQLLKETGINDPEQRINQYPFELSGGMLQRIVIAMALAGEPKIILADEPTTSLDVTIQKQIIDLLKKIQKDKGLALVFVSHDLALVSQIAHKVLVMYAGEAIEYSEALNVFQSARHPYTQALLASLPDFKAEKQAQGLKVIEGSPPDLSQEIKLCAFSERCKHRMNICDKEKPPLLKIDKHPARCWLVQKPAID